MLAVYVEFMKNRVQTFSSNQSVNQPAGLCFKVEKDKILFTAKHCDDVWYFLSLPSNPSRGKKRKKKKDKNSQPVSQSVSQKEKERERERERERDRDRETERERERICVTSFFTYVFLHLETKSKKKIVCSIMIDFTFITFQYFSDKFV